MPIYALTENELVPVSATSFSAENIHERRHIQQLLKANISVLDPGLMVIAEEFGDWVDSARRIDLLCIDTDANLVVVELKRTEDGGHMELQALRYAAMISAMTFEQLVETYARYLNPGQPDHDDALTGILQFLGWDSPNEDQFGQDTRIILASANFSRELTTTVLWLRDRNIDVRCVRLQPYRLADGRVLLDVQQLIPLPETASFQTRIGVKRQAERRERTERHDQRMQFWSELVARPDATHHGHITPGIYSWIGTSAGVRGIGLNLSVRKQDCQAEIYIDRGRGADEDNLAIFDQLFAQREQIETAFGGELRWQRLENSRACRIAAPCPGGWQSPEEEWNHIHQELLATCDRLHNAIAPHLQRLTIKG